MTRRIDYITRRVYDVVCTDGEQCLRSFSVACERAAFHCLRRCRRVAADASVRCAPLPVLCHWSTALDACRPAPTDRPSFSPRHCPLLLISALRTQLSVPSSTVRSCAFHFLPPAPFRPVALIVAARQCINAEVEDFGQGRSGDGVGLATGGRGFNPSRCTVECNCGQVVHTHCPAPLLLQPYGAI